MLVGMGATRDMAITLLKNCNGNLQHASEILYNSLN
jgi:hypothetical protein